MIPSFKSFMIKLKFMKKWNIWKKYMKYMTYMKKYIMSGLLGGNIFIN